VLFRSLPIKARIDDIYNDAEYLHKVVKQGADKARESAAATLALARKAIGFKAF
jgi:tryptophanyl-tRNA synthetase